MFSGQFIIDDMYWPSEVYILEVWAKDHAGNEATLEHGVDYTSPVLSVNGSISDNDPPEITIDPYFSNAYLGPTDSDILTASLIGKDFSSCKDKLVIIRAEVVERPFYLPHS